LILQKITIFRGSLARIPGKNNKGIYPISASIILGNHRDLYPHEASRLWTQYQQEGSRLLQKDWYLQLWQQDHHDHLVPDGFRAPKDIICSLAKVVVWVEHGSKWSCFRRFRSVMIGCRFQLWNQGPVRQNFCRSNANPGFFIGKKSGMGNLHWIPRGKLWYIGRMAPLFPVRKHYITLLALYPLSGPNKSQSSPITHCFCKSLVVHGLKSLLSVFHLLTSHHGLTFSQRWRQWASKKAVAWRRSGDYHTVHGFASPRRIEACTVRCLFWWGNEVLNQGDFEVPHGTLFSDKPTCSPCRKMISPV
jgi:hypothetical protein